MGDGVVSTSAPAQAGAGQSASQADAASQAVVKDSQATSVTADDPEIELDSGLRLKRSELRELHAKRKELDRGAYDKFQQAAKMDKESKQRLAQAEELAAALSKDTKAALIRAGIDPFKFAEQTLADQLSEWKLTPAEKEARELKAENERFKAEKAEREKTEAENKTAAEVTQWEQRFDQAFASAIQTSGLPKTARVVSRMAEKVESYWGAGIKIPLEEIAAEIKQDLIAERRELLQSIKDEQLGELYDDAELEKARKLILRKAQGSQPQTPKVRPKPAPPKPKNGLTRAELDARITKRIGA